MYWKAAGMCRKNRKKLAGMSENKHFLEKHVGTDPNNWISDKSDRENAPELYFPKKGANDHPGAILIILNKHTREKCCIILNRY